MLKSTFRGYSIANQILKGANRHKNVATASLSTRPQYGFAKHKEKICIHRKRLYSYFKDLFSGYHDEIQKEVLSYDLGYTMLVLKNALHFQLMNDELLEDILDNVRSRSHTLTPPLAYELLLGLQDFGRAKNADIFKMLYEYIQNYFFVYTHKELQTMEKVYFNLSNQMLLDYNPLLTGGTGGAVASQKATYAMSSKERAQKVLEAYRIKANYELTEVGYNRLENSVNIKFKDSGKQLTILGQSKFDSGDIKAAREKMLESLYDVYIFESAPLTLSELKTMRKDLDKISTGRDEVAEALRFLERKEHVAHPRDERLFWDYLWRVGEIALFNPADIEAYFKEYISASKQYEINESERVVYEIENFNKRPYTVLSLLLQLRRIKKHDFRVLFADTPAIYELNEIARNISVKDSQKIFNHARMLLLNAKTQWAIEINKKGCPSCSKSFYDPPEDISNYLAFQNFNFSVKEAAFGRQIVKALRLLQGKNYIAFVEHTNLIPVIKAIFAEISKEQRPTKGHEITSNDELSQKFLTKSVEKQGMTEPFPNDKEKKQFVQKYAAIAAFYSIESDIQLPPYVDFNSDEYKKYLDGFKKYLSMESFDKPVGASYDTRGETGSCYAKDSLLGSGLKSDKA